MTPDLESYERFIKERLAVLDKVANLESIIILKKSLVRRHLPLPD